MADGNPITTWGAILRGEHFDLEGWDQLFRGEDARIERYAQDGVLQYVLKSNRFDGVLDPHEARALAEDLIGEMNGAARVYDVAEPITFGGLYAYRKNQQRDTAIFTQSVSARLRVGSLFVTQTGEPPTRPVESEDAVRLAHGDENVSDALSHFGRSSGWLDIYKTLEVIAADLGRRDKIWQLGWATRDDVTALAVTANYNRHARGAELPPKPLHIGEAQSLLRVILRQWIEEKRQAQAIPGSPSP